jgi:hypothetical protein
VPRFLGTLDKGVEMIKSWQTTLIGCVALVVGGYLLYAGRITWDQFLLFLSVFGIGLTAKDHNVTGGTIEQ